MIASSKFIISLLNDDQLTIDKFSSFIFHHVEKFQQEREEFYIKQFESSVENNPENFDFNQIDFYTEDIFGNITADSKLFIEGFVKSVSDIIMDACSDQKVDKKVAEFALTMSMLIKEALLKSLVVEFEK